MPRLPRITKSRYSLTSMKKEEYVRNGGTKCPFCFKKNIEGGHIEVDAGEAFQEVQCHDCEKRWRDIYTLIDLEEI